MPLHIVAIMIETVPALCVKNTVLPSGVKDGAESSPSGHAASGGKSFGAGAALISGSVSWSSVAPAAGKKRGAASTRESRTWGCLITRVSVALASLVTCADVGLGRRAVAHASVIATSVARIETPYWCSAMV